MPRKPKITQAMELEPGDTVVVGPNPVLMAEGTVGTFLFYSECGPPIIEVAGRGRFLVPERCLTVHERPWAPPDDEPDATLPDLPRAQSDRLLAFMAQRAARGATPAPHRPPPRRNAIMPLAWEQHTDAAEPTMGRQLARAQWDATGLAAWVERLEPGNAHESVALHELRRALGEMTYWLAEFRYAREAVTA